MWLVNKKRSVNRQLAINMTASMVTFLVGMGIQFFLTPYIVKSLGPEAYGFIGLSANIISYTSLITIALNSMAGRFVTISYTTKDYVNANKYFTSVFFSNLFFAIIILTAAVGCVVYLEFLINVPHQLIADVKALFVLLVVDNIVSLLANVWGLATFIENRLDLSNIRVIIGNILKATVLVLLFSLFEPCIWYVGAAGLVMTLYTVLTNRILTRQLTPELRISISSFDFSKVKELFLSGVWNLFTKLADLIGSQLDLILVNLFIGATAMGYFYISKNVPILILHLFQMIANVFAPLLTKLYAGNNIQELEKELNKSIRILGFFTTIPIVILFCFGDDFYNLWVPTENSQELQLLTLLGAYGMIFSMPLEALWNIFTITNKLKYSTLYIFFQQVTGFLIIIVCMSFIDDTFIKLCVLAGTRTTLGLIKSLIFLPLYGAKCLNLRYSVFYPPLIKSFFCFVLAMIAGILLKQCFTIYSWISLFVISSLCALSTIVINYNVVLTQSDRYYIHSMVMSKINSFKL